jgi:hypothetical protein
VGMKWAYFLFTEAYGMNVLMKYQEEWTMHRLI